MAIPIDLSGKVACITGAGRGMGRVTALKLAEAGAAVGVADMNLASAEAVSQEIIAAGGKSIGLYANVTKKDEVEKMVDDTVAEFGRLDIMVNNAGITFGKLLIDLEEKDLDRVMDVNVKGVLFGMQAAMKYFIPQRYGKVVNLASQASKEAGASYGAYSAAKAAVLSLTQCMAKETGQYNINVNAVCPGMILTDLWTKDTGGQPGLLLMQQQTEMFKGKSTEEIWADMCSTMLLGRAQTPEDIAMLIIYLASDFAANMTGQGVNITGGMMLH